MKSRDESDVALANALLDVRNDPLDVNQMVYLCLLI